MTKKIMVVAGGTGGHIFPGIAVVQTLEQQGWQSVWLGTRDRMEADVVPKHGIDIRFIDVKGLRGNGIVRLLKAPLMILKAIWQAYKVLKTEQPNVLLGMGGYVTGPAGIAAKLLGIPLVVHEQNAVAGMSNKLLARIANRVLAAFPSAFPTREAAVVGNPVRQSVVTIESQLTQGQMNILVVGGSLGAQVFNQELPGLFSKLAKEHTLSVWHQTGKGNRSEVEKRYSNVQCETKVTDFIDDMDAAYAWANIVICRAGALTVSEVAAAGKMALFVPFPSAVDDHQTANANFLVSNDAALLIQQSQMSHEKLAAMLQPFLASPSKVADMAQRAKQLAKVDAADQVAAHCIELSR